MVHWMRIKILRSLPMQMAPELWYGTKSGLQLLFCRYFTCLRNTILSTIQLVESCEEIIEGSNSERRQKRAMTPAMTATSTRYGTEPTRINAPRHYIRASSKNNNQMYHYKYLMYHEKLNWEYPSCRHEQAETQRNMRQKPKLKRADTTLRVWELSKSRCGCT